MGRVSSLMYIDFDGETVYDDNDKSKYKVKINTIWR